MNINVTKVGLLQVAALKASVCNAFGNSLSLCGYSKRWYEMASQIQLRKELLLQKAMIYIHIQPCAC